MRSPVLFMIFKRPETTARVFQAIREARPPRLYIAADGPRPDHPGEDELCDRTREIAAEVDWDCDVKTLLRKRNLGCALACSASISWFFKQETEGIILEDDVLPHPDFFPFCDHLLERYRDEPGIFQISANNFQMGIKRGSASYYFSRFTHIWGWASWARAWRHYDHSMAGLTRFLREELPVIFPDPSVVRLFSLTLSRVRANHIPTWDFRWFYAALKYGGLTILPNHNLARNIGFGGDGTNWLGPSLWDYWETGPMRDIAHPGSIQADADTDWLTAKIAFSPSGESLPSLLREGCRRLENGLAHSTGELLRLARAMHGNAPLLDWLEAASRKLAGKNREDPL